MLVSGYIWYGSIIEDIWSITCHDVSVHMLWRQCSHGLDEVLNTLHISYGDVYILTVYSRRKYFEKKIVFTVHGVERFVRMWKAYKYNIMSKETFRTSHSGRIPQIPSHKYPRKPWQWVHHFKFHDANQLHSSLVNRFSNFLVLKIQHSRYALSLQVSQHG